MWLRGARSPNGEAMSPTSFPAALSFIRVIRAIGGRKLLNSSGLGKRPPSRPAPRTVPLQERQTARSPRRLSPRRRPREPHHHYAHGIRRAGSNASVTSGDGGIGRDQRGHTNLRRFTLAGSRRGQQQWSRPEPSPRREKRKVDAVEQRTRETRPPVKPGQTWKKHHPKRTRIGLRSAFGA